MGSGPSPTQTQTTEMKLGPEQKEVFSFAKPYIKAYSEAEPTMYPGTGIAELDPSEEFAQQYYSNIAAPTTAGLAGQAAGAQSLMMNPDFMLNPNQYVHAAGDAMTQRTTQNLMESILPQIRSGATMTGGMYADNTKENLTQGKAIGDTSDAISRQLAGMYLQNYQQGLTGMGSAIAQNQNVMQQQLFPANIMAAVGAQKRGVEQAKLDEEINRYYAQQDMPLWKAQQLMNLIAGMPGGTGTTTMTGVAPKSNPLMSMLGIGASLLSAPMTGGGSLMGMLPGMAMK